MDVLTAPRELSQVLDAARASGRSVGLVPTMGALHDGHRRLIERAAAECDTVVVTIFVNPLQFGEARDIDSYPRTLDADVVICDAAGASIVLAPSVADMYPRRLGSGATTVSVAGVSDGWEGEARVGHFDGVATVVAKLFAMTGRCRAYFGEKDFQQLAVVRQVATDLSLPVDVVGCTTVREDDGLALSSRNARLTVPERAAAPVLYRALRLGASTVAEGAPHPSSVVEVMRRELSGEPLAAPDYAAVVDARDLSVPPQLHRGIPLRLLIAARFGSARLIDNCEAFSPRAPVADASVTAPSRHGARTESSTVPALTGV